MLALAETHFPADTWTCLSPQLVLLFWGLAAYDLSTPTARYELERKRLATKLTQLEHRGDAMPARARRQEATRLAQLGKELGEELTAQRRHTEAVCRLLGALREGLFRGAGRAEDPLLQTCLLARALLSPTDAVYCSQFCALLHRMDTPLFSWVRCTDALVHCLPLLYGCTEFEASFLGYALSHVFVGVNKWVASKAIYDVEGGAKTGATADFATGAKLDYAQFRTRVKVDPCCPTTDSLPDSLAC